MPILLLLLSLNLAFVNLVYNMTIYIESILGMVEEDAKIGYIYIWMYAYVYVWLCACFPL